MQLSEPRNRRWTRGQYHRMAEMGFFRDQRVELIGGGVVEMAPQKDTHVIAVSLAAKAVAAAFGDKFWVRVQAPLSLGTYDEPEPDLAVVAGSERDYMGSGNRATALLVIEVSDTTLAYDRVRKARRYARAGIADYWIVNLQDRWLEVYRDPARRGAAYAYAPVQMIGASGSFAPLANPGRPIRVSDLLP